MHVSLNFWNNNLKLPANSDNTFSNIPVQSTLARLLFSLDAGKILQNCLVIGSLAAFWKRVSGAKLGFGSSEDDSWKEVQN
jgi:hypothetical protein